MAKKFIEVFDIDTDTEVVFLSHNDLQKGKIVNYKFYNAETLKYDIVHENILIKDVSALNIFESKETYIDYIKNLML